MKRKHISFFLSLVMAYTAFNTSVYAEDNGTEDISETGEDITEAVAEESDDTETEEIVFEENDSAEEEYFAEEDSDYELSVDGSTAKITGYTGTDTELEIPSDINGYTITGIGSYAFSNCAGLTSVTIPDTVTFIEANAFNGCSSLSKVIIPASVTKMANRIFYNCSLLQSAGYSGSGADIEFDWEDIPASAFQGANCLTDVSLSDDTSEIGTDAFADCIKLTSIIIPDQTYVIGTRAFSGCQVLEEIELVSVTEIKANAFANCIGLVNVFAAELKTIGNNAFESCRNLENIILTNKLSSVGVSAFQNCKNLTAHYYGSKRQFNASVSVGSGNDYLKNGILYYAPDAITFKEGVQADYEIGRTFKLTPEFTSDNPDVLKDVVWSSDDTGVAQVDENGNVTVKAYGQAVITASSVIDKEISGSYTVVVPIPVDSVKMNKTTVSLAAGKTETLKGTVSPADATYPELTWKSSNTAVAVVDANGKVTAKAVGTATITTSSGNGKKATCKVVVYGWIKQNNSWKYLNSNGKYTENGWQLIFGKWYYFKNTVMKTGWIASGGKWYYLNSSGAMVAGWQKVSGKWYYMNGSGAMLTGWQKISGVWYYLESSGAMATGWKKITGVWYYMNSSGAMQTGWHKISGTWYYFKSSGAMVTGTYTIDGKTYRFGSSGAWIS